MSSPPCVSRSRFLYGKLMQPVLRSAGWLRLSLTHFWPDIRDISKASIGEGREGAEGCWLYLPHSHISTSIPHQLPLKLLYMHTSSHATWLHWRDKKEGGVMELYGNGQSLSIHWAFYHPLIQRSSVLVATKRPGQRQERQGRVVLEGGYLTPC